MLIHVGLGSNTGDRMANLAAALEQLATVATVRLVGLSHVYESQAWPDPSGPAFANAVALVDTRLEAHLLLAELKDIEASMGRDAAAPANSPRPIDLDILLAESEEWQSPALTIPHPRMAERDFVIGPLLELSPDARWPDGSRITRDAVRAGRITGVLGQVPGFEALYRGRPAGEMPAVPPSPIDGAMRTPLPGEDWVAVHSRPGYSPVYSMPSAFANGLGAMSGSHKPAAVPSPESGFVDVVLEQAGIPHEWDPFPPDLTSDPYNLSRPFVVKVPASMREDAERAIAEAVAAPVDWTEAYEMAGEHPPGDEPEDD